MSTLLSEAFKKLNLLEEEDFNLTDKDGADELSMFLDNDEDASIYVIDDEADDRDELEDSYEGQVILDCPVCHSKIFKKIDAVKINDGEELANVGDECPYCFSVGGFNVIGQVAPFVSQDSIEVSVEDKDKDGEIESDEVDVVVKDESLKEDFEKVELETDDQKIKIETEPKESRETEEQIIPVTDEVASEISDESTDEFEAEPDVIEDEVDVDEFDDESFDELGESYLKEVYKNVKSFKTTKVQENLDGKLCIEGNITFRSGNVKPTKFLFEQRKTKNLNKIKLIGENLNITRGKKAFSLTGSINNNTFICESLNYNYSAKDPKGKSTRLYGTVKR